MDVCLCKKMDITFANAMYNKINVFFPILATSMFLITSCEPKIKPDVPDNPAGDGKIVLADYPPFSADSAFAYVAKQVDFGPRVPNTAAHARCAAFLRSELARFCDTVIVQEAPATTYDGTKILMKNIIGVFNPNAKNRILLCAHWDTRPFADQDPDRPTERFDGANDGGSGVGVLLEMARQFHARKPGIGIDIVFFDAEDWGDASGTVRDSYCLGSQYWSKNPHVPGYKAMYGILLDMVGGKDAYFAWEVNSVASARQLIIRLWDIAGATRLREAFRAHGTRPCYRRPRLYHPQYEYSDG
jgi:glutaminyl-peptide cyclotransferase